MSTGENDLKSLRETFFEEAEDRLRTLESLFLSFESCSEDLEIVNTIFREVHSLKGGAAACGLDQLANFAHVFEGLLSQVRLGLLKPTAATHATMLESVDALDSLFNSARGFEARHEEGDVAMIAARIRQELGLRHSEPARASENEVVLWLDDEVAQVPETLPHEQTLAMSMADAPVPSPASTRHATSDLAPAECAQSTPQQVTHVEDEEDEEQMSSFSDAEMNRLVDLAIELTITASALSHVLSDSSALQIDRVRALFSDSCAHADAIQHALEGIRTEGASAISEVVLVAVAERTYFLPLSSVDSYFSLEPSTLRRIPGVGEVLNLDSSTLYLLRLSELMQASDRKGDGAVLVAMRSHVGPFALLVDQVLEQTRVVIRPLDPMFKRSGSVLGAAIYAGNVVLVLDPGKLSSLPRSGANVALELAVA